MPSSYLFFLIAADAIRMVQRVVARYRPAVAAILPNTLNTLNNYRGPADQVTSLYMGMRNQTAPNRCQRGIPTPGVLSTESAEGIVEH